MKTTNIICWITTGLLSLMMTFSAYAYLTASSDPVSERSMPIVALVLLAGSYITFQKKSKVVFQSSPLSKAII